MWLTCFHVLLYWKPARIREYFKFKAWRKRRGQWINVDSKCYHSLWRNFVSFRYPDKSTPGGCLISTDWSKYQNEAWKYQKYIREWSAWICVRKKYIYTRAGVTQCIPSSVVDSDTNGYIILYWYLNETTVSYNLHLQCTE